MRTTQNNCKNFSKANDARVSLASDTQASLASDMQVSLTSESVRNTYDTLNEISLEQGLKNAEAFLQLGNTFKALQIYNQLANTHAGDYRVWECLFNCTNKIEYYENMVKLNPACAEKYKDAIDNISQDLVSKFQQQKETFEQHIDSIKRFIKKNESEIKPLRGPLIAGSCCVAAYCLFLLFAVIVNAIVKNTVFSISLVGCGAVSFIALLIVLGLLKKRSNNNDIFRSTITDLVAEIEFYNKKIKENGEVVEELKNKSLNAIKRIQVIEATWQEINYYSAEPRYLKSLYWRLNGRY